MEMEDETNTATSSDSNENLNEDENEIAIDDDDPGDLDFDVISDEEEEEEDEDDELDNLPALEESDLFDLDVEDSLVSTDSFSVTPQEDEFLHKFDEDDLSPLSFAGKQVVIFDMAKEQAELLKKYLSERTGMEVECVTKKQNLWRFLKIDPLDLIIMETGSEANTGALELMQETKDRFPEVHFICLSGPVSLERRLQFLNAGALDYLTRPVHLSTIAQSILVQFSHTDIYDIDNELSDLDSEAHDIPEEEPIVDSTETLPEKNSGGTVNQLGEDLNLSKEIDLIHEDF